MEPSVVPSLIELASLKLSEDVGNLPDHLLDSIRIATEDRIRYRVYREDVRPALLRLRLEADRVLGNAYSGGFSNVDVVPELDPLGEQRGIGTGDPWMERCTSAMLGRISDVHEASMRSLAMELDTGRMRRRRKLYRSSSAESSAGGSSPCSESGGTDGHYGHDDTSEGEIFGY